MPILGSEFEILFYYYLCEDSGEQFTDTMLDDLNFSQLSAKRTKRLSIS